MKLSKHDRKLQSKERKIGHIRQDEHGDYMVKMGTTDEAVVGIKMLPISTLITDPELRRKVVATTKSFFEKSQDYSCKLPYINTVSHERYITMVILSPFLLNYNGTDNMPSSPKELLFSKLQFLTQLY